jgi:hypothetical protein
VRNDLLRLVGSESTSRVCYYNRQTYQLAKQVFLCRAT